MRQSRFVTRSDRPRAGVPVAWVLAGLLVLPLPAAGVVAAEAQEPVRPKASYGLTYDRYLIREDRRDGMSFRGTTLRPSQWSSEFAIGTLFRHAREDPPVFGLDLGTAYNAPVSGSAILIKAGATGLFAPYRGGGGVLGAYGGLGFIARVAPGYGFRADVTRRWFLGVSVPVWQVDVGLVTLPLSGAGDPP